MNTFRSTSRRRPSRHTIARRQIEKRKDDEAIAWGALIWVHRDIAADIDLRYWAAGLDGAARVFGEIGTALDRKRAATLNALADEAKAGVVDATEDSEDFDHKQYLAELADAKADANYSDLPF